MSDYISESKPENVSGNMGGYDHQGDGWKDLKSKEDLEKDYFGDDFSGKAHKVGSAHPSYDKRVEYWGEPIGKNALDIETFWVDGCGRDFNKSLRLKVHKELAPLVKKVFNAIQRENRRRYRFYYLGSYYARYIWKRKHLYDIIRDGKDHLSTKDIKVKKDSGKYKKGDIIPKGSVLYEARTYPEPPFIPVDKRKKTEKHHEQWAKKGGVGGGWVSASFKHDFKAGTIIKRSVSNHSFGTAIDINPGTNKYDKGAHFDIPPWLVQIFLDHGFYWGGFYGDYMHFEFLQPPENIGNYVDGVEAKSAGKPKPKPKAAPPEPKPAVGEAPPPATSTRVVEISSPDARPRPRWSQPLAANGEALSAEELFSRNEQGAHGFFPLGAFNTWHGGVHLHGAGEVRAIHDGIIVAARLPETDALAQRQTSRNFILVRHELAANTDGERVIKPLWSLYFHLAPFTYDGDLAAKLPWLGPQLDGYRPDLDAEKRYYEVLTDEDPPVGGEGPYGLRLRAKGTSKSEILNVVEKGALVEILEDDPGGWTKVATTSGTYVTEGGVSRPGQLIGGSDFVHQEGYIYTGGSRVRRVDPETMQEIEALRAGKVVALNVSVRAGEALGEAGSIAGKPGVHVEVTSEAPLTDVKELSDLRLFSDPDNDAIVSVGELIELVDGLGFSMIQDGKLSREEIKVKAPELRDVAAFHMSEWAADDWSPLLGKPWKKSEGWLERETSYIKLLQWWKLAQAVDKRKLLPKSPKLWHYHPVELVRRLQQAYAAGGSQENAAVAGLELAELAVIDPPGEADGAPLVETHQASATPAAAPAKPAKKKKAPKPKRELVRAARAEDFFVLDSAETVPLSHWEEKWKAKYKTKAWKNSWRDNTPLSQMKVTRKDGKPVVFSYTANIAVCSDGISPSVYGSAKEYDELVDEHGKTKAREIMKERQKAGGFKYVDYWGQPRTAYRDPFTKDYLKPETTPYIVTNPQVRGSYTGVQKGDLCLVKLRDKSVFAINGESGPSFKAGEASMYVCKALGLKDNPLSGGISGERPRDQVVEYIILPGSKDKYPKTEELTAEGLQKYGRQAFEEAAKLGHLRYEGGHTDTWQYPVAPFDPDDPEPHFKAVEDAEEGFFPIGKNRLWHGGVHLKADGAVRACASGRIVGACVARPKAKRERNFVIIKHQAPDSEGESKPVWSLYYHLSAATCDGEAQIPWLDAIADGFDSDLSGERFLRIQTDEDEGGLNLRKLENTKTILTQVPFGELVELVEYLDDQKRYAKVRHDGQEGRIAVFGGRADEVSAEELKKVKSLAAGEVVSLDLPIAVGDVIGRVEGSLHFEIMSEENLAGHEGEPWTFLKDPEDDPVADAALLTQRVEHDNTDAVPLAFEEKGPAEEAQKATQDAHYLAVERVSEWAVGDLSKLGEATGLMDAALEAAKDEVRSHQWWEKVERKPASQRIVSYNPIAFVHMFASGKLMEEPAPKATEQTSALEKSKRTLADIAEMLGNLDKAEELEQKAAAPWGGWWSDDEEKEEAKPLSPDVWGTDEAELHKRLLGFTTAKDWWTQPHDLDMTTQPSKAERAAAKKRAEERAKKTGKKVRYRDWGPSTKFREETGIYVPEGMRVQSSVDVVLFLHGKHAGAYKTVGELLKYDDIRGSFEKGDRHAVFLIPKLASNSGVGRGKKALNDPTGFKAWLDTMLAALAAPGPWKSKPQLRSLVVAAHSGGGLPAIQILQMLDKHHKDTIGSKVKALWMFDALYTSSKPYISYLKSRPDVKAEFRYGGSTKTNTVGLNRKYKRAGVVVKKSKKGHSTVGSYYLWQFLRAADWLKDRGQLDEDDDPSNEFYCESASGIVVHADLQKAVKEARKLTGFELSVKGGVCPKPPKLCPTDLKKAHEGGNALHITNLPRHAAKGGKACFHIRAAELAGLYGLDVSVLGSKKSATRLKALHVEQGDAGKITKLAVPGVKAKNPNAPWAKLGVVFIRKRSKCEIHLQREHAVPRAIVDGEDWRCLPLEATEGTDYVLHRKTYWLGSYHRQWGRAATIRWLKGLSAFYRTVAGETLGIGDVSHVVGEDQTNHNSHERGVDVDLYPLGPEGPALRETYLTSGPKNALVVQQIRLDTKATPNFRYYTGVADMGQTEQDAVLRKHAIVMAYCLLTQGMAEKCVWHGAPAMSADAAEIARNYQATANPAWGTTEKWWHTGTIRDTWRGFVGKGSGSYEVKGGWPAHKDHLHVRVSKKYD